jgi:anti-anti-sigma factor
MDWGFSINKQEEGEDFLMIYEEINDNTLILYPEGKLGTNACRKFETEMNEFLARGVKKLILDFRKMLYISSAGLRVLVTVQKKLSKIDGRMVVKNVNNLIMEVFKISGFAEILAIES